MTKNVEGPSIISNLQILKQRWWAARPASERLAFLSIALWLCSIPLPGTVYPSAVSDLKSVFGYQILLAGWAGPLAGVFGWYANPLYLYVCWKLLKTNKLPRRAAGFGVFFASTIFIFFNIPDPDTVLIGHSLRMYGYGWGAFSWYSAILLAAIAVGVKSLEQQGRYQGWRSIRSDGLAITAGVLLVAWVGGSLSVGVVQKLFAGHTERERLYHVTFKLGPVCTTSDHKTLARIPLTGALQVFADSKASPVGLAWPATLISWGIPVVRKGRFDYYRSDSSADWHLVAGPHHGPVGAKLTTERSFHGRYVVRTRLVSGDDSVVAIDAKWLSGRDPDPHYCPGYFPAAKESEPPRSLLLSALVRPDGVFAPPPRQKLLFDGGEHEDMEVKRVAVVGKIQRSTITGNAGCPDDIGLRYLRLTKANPSERVFTPPPSWGLVAPQSVKFLHEELSEQGQLVFQMREHFHFINSIRIMEAACSAQDAYLGWGHVAGRASVHDYLYLQKRTLPRFKKAWPLDRWIRFRRTGDAATAPYEKFHLYSVSETENGLRIVLAYFTKGTEEGALVELEAEAAQSEPSVER